MQSSHQATTAEHFIREAMKAIAIQNKDLEVYMCKVCEGLTVRP